MVARRQNHQSDADPVQDEIQHQADRDGRHQIGRMHGPIGLDDAKVDGRRHADEGADEAGNDEQRTLSLQGAAGAPEFRVGYKPGAHEKIVQLTRVGMRWPPT